MSRENPVGGRDQSASGAAVASHADVAGAHRSGRDLCLVAGANKALPLRHVLEGVGDWIRYPAAGVRLGTGTVIWWVDREAAGLAPDPRIRDAVRRRV
jgi:hypothetical protein